MKHAREDYNRIQDPEHKIPEDEPVFLLRGQDKVAASAVRYWAVLAYRMGAKPDIVDAAGKCDGRMAAGASDQNPGSLSRAGPGG